jgi:hypothetical protein
MPTIEEDPEVDTQDNPIEVFNQSKEVIKKEINAYLEWYFDYKLHKKNGIKRENFTFSNITSRVFWKLTGSTSK